MDDITAATCASYESLVTLHYKKRHNGDEATSLLAQAMC